MRGLVVVGDKRLRVGDKLRSNGNAKENGICRDDAVLTVRTFKDEGELLVGLYSGVRLKGWGSLDGAVENGHGFWATRDTIMDCFELMSNEHVISDDVVYKKHNLRGMRCTVLHTDPHSMSSFVELEKNVGGGGADGHGKQGHCVVVPYSSVKKKPYKKGEEPVIRNWFKSKIKEVQNG